MRRVALLLAFGCRSTTRADERPRDAAAAITADAGGNMPAFVRLPATIIEKVRWEANATFANEEPRGELVGHMEQLGAFACRLTTLFGPPDLQLRLAAEPISVGFPLRHVATGMLVVPHLGGGRHWGHAGAVVIRDNGAILYEPRAWHGLKPPGFEAVTEELDDLLEATTPKDCEVEFGGGLLVSRAGIKAGTPFFEHLESSEQLVYRLAELEGNDRSERADRAVIDSDLCFRSLVAWDNAKRARTNLGPHTRLRARLRGCIETKLTALERDVAEDRFDRDTAPEELDQLVEYARLLDLHDAVLKRRFGVVQARIKRG